MIQKTKLLPVQCIIVFIFCLLFSGCVIYPEDEGFEGFPQKVRVAFLSSGAPSFKGPPEIVGLNLDPDCSDYTSSAKTFLLSYTGAGQEDFNDYANYLVVEFGNFYDVSENNYSCYGWLNGRVGVELGFSTLPVSASETDLSISFIPSYTLYMLIAIY
jgi:hypothetical protein